MAIFKCLTASHLGNYTQISVIHDNTKTNYRMSTLQVSSRVFYSFIRPFIALATAKLDLAMTCRDSFVTSANA